MARYSYSRKADSDLETIAHYTILNFGIAQARAYRKLIDQAATMAAQFPKMGRPYTTKGGDGFFRHYVGRHVLFYREDEGGILIVRVLHQSMDYDRHL